MRNTRGKLTIRLFRNGELLNASADSLNKQFDIDDDTIGRYVALACSMRAIQPLIENRTSFARSAQVRQWLVCMENAASRPVEVNCSAI